APIPRWCQQQTPDLHTVERFPRDWFQIAERKLLELWIDGRELLRFLRRNIQDDELAHVARADFAERELRTVLAEAHVVLPRGAMIPVRSPVDMNAIFLPSGENCGDTFMPARSTIGRVAPPSIATAKMRV